MPAPNFLKPPGRNHAGNSLVKVPRTRVLHIPVGNSRSDRKPYDGYGLMLPSEMEGRRNNARDRKPVPPRKFELKEGDRDPVTGLTVTYGDPTPIPWFLVPDRLWVDEG